MDNDDKPIKEYYVRFWAEAFLEYRYGISDRLNYNEVLRCYEGYLFGTDPDDILTRIQASYAECKIQRCGEVLDD